MFRVDRCEDGLYVLDRHYKAFPSIVTSSLSRASAHIWHARLGHPNYRLVDFLSKSGVISCSRCRSRVDSHLLAKAIVYHLLSIINIVLCILISYIMIYGDLHLSLHPWIFDTMLCSLMIVLSFFGFFPLNHNFDFYDTFINVQRYIVT